MSGASSPSLSDASYLSRSHRAQDRLATKLLVWLRSTLRSQSPTSLYIIAQRWEDIRQDLDRDCLLSLITHLNRMISVS